MISPIASLATRILSGTAPAAMEAAPAVTAPIAEVTVGAAKAGLESAVAPIGRIAAESAANVALDTAEAQALESIAVNAGGGAGGIHKALVTLGNEAEVLPPGLPITNTALGVNNVEPKTGLDTPDINGQVNIEGETKSTPSSTSESEEAAQTPNQHESSNQEQVRTVSGEVITDPNQKYKEPGQEPNNQQTEPGEKDSYEEFFESRRKAGKTWEQIYEEIKAEPSQELANSLRDKLTERLLRELLDKRKSEEEQRRLRREMEKMKKEMKQLVENQREVLREIKRIKDESASQFTDLQKAA